MQTSCHSYQNNANTIISYNKLHRLAPSATSYSKGNSRHLIFERLVEYSRASTRNTRWQANKEAVFQGDELSTNCNRVSNCSRPIWTSNSNPNKLDPPPNTQTFVNLVPTFISRNLTRRLWDCSSSSSWIKAPGCWDCAREIWTWF